MFFSRHFARIPATCLFVAVIILILGPVRADAADKVILQLRWDHQFQFAGYYAAKWKDFYRKAGIEVEIRSALSSPKDVRSAIKEVSEGRADFGIGGADILIAHDQGKSLVVLASIFQTSAAAFYALADTPLINPASFAKLKVARRVNDLIDVELQAMLRAEGINPSTVTPYPHKPGYGHLTSGQVDVLPGYRISVPFEAAQQGIKLRRILPSEYGIDFYGDSIFASNVLVDKDPELVKRFLAHIIHDYRRI